MKKTLTGLDFKIQEMAGRIRELREISGLSAQTMALKTGTSEEEYLRDRPKTKKKWRRKYRQSIVYN